VLTSCGGGGGDVAGGGGDRAARSGDRAGCRAGDCARSCELGAAALGAFVGIGERAASACKRSFRRSTSEDVRAGGCSETAHRVGQSRRRRVKAQQTGGCRTARTWAMSECRVVGLPAPAQSSTAYVPRAGGALSWRSSHDATRASVSLSLSSSSSGGGGRLRGCCSSSEPAGRCRSMVATDGSCPAGWRRSRGEEAAASGEADGRRAAAMPAKLLALSCSSAPGTIVDSVAATDDTSSSAGRSRNISPATTVYSAATLGSRGGMAEEGQTAVPG
jgi:hypothetical protein